jgi:flagellar protein FliJ
VKQPAFRLEPVLRLRRTEERAASLAAAAAAREATAAEQRAQEQADALGCRSLPPRAPGDSFIAAMVASSRAAADVAEAWALAVARAEQAEVVRSRWTEAVQRTKAMERLRERHIAELRAAAEAVENRTVDDLVTGQYGRNRGTGEEGT